MFEALLCLEKPRRERMSMLAMLAVVAILATTTEKVLWGLVIVVGILYLWKRSGRKPKAPTR